MNKKTKINFLTVTNFIFVILFTADLVFFIFPLFLHLQTLIFLDTIIAICLFVLGRRLGCLEEDGAPPDCQKFISEVQIQLSLMQRLVFGIPFYRIYKTKTWRRFLDTNVNILNFTLDCFEKKLKQTTVSLCTFNR